MSQNREPPELYQRYRPKSFKEMVGQDDLILSLQLMLEENRLPHCLLLSGSSGCGKTTTARILANKLGCSEYGDVTEINAAEQRGIDSVRTIQSAMRTRPYGKAKVYIVDECHQWTNDASNAALKMLEDSPHWVYFFLCTTDPQKVLATIRTRATELRFKSVGHRTLCLLVADVVAKYFKGDEGSYLSDDVIEKIAEVADGSPRKALVYLHQVIDLPTPDEQFTVLERGDTKRQAIEIARLLVNGGNWKQIAEVIKNIDDEPETVRHIVLAYATTILLSGGKLAGRAMELINRFEMNWYDGKKASMVAACYDVCHKK